MTNKTKTFRFIGRKFSTDKSFYDWDKEHRFFHYEQTEEKELGTFTFSDLDEADKFFLLNFPEWYFGSNIVGVDNNDFSLQCVPEYYEQIFRTSDRKAILDRLTAELLDRLSKK